MSDLDRLSREQEEARRSRILSEIWNKQCEVSHLKSQIKALEDSKINLNNSVHKWTDAKSRFEKNYVAKNVVVKNVFEGKAAESVQKNNETRIVNMDEKIKMVVSIEEKLSSQIESVSTKVITLNSEITDLRNQL